MSSKICRKRPSYFFRIVFLVLRYSGLRAAGARADHPAASAWAALRDRVTCRAMTCVARNK
jgi:hypothetical protein